MHFLWTLLIGLVVGAIAKLLMPGRDPGGVIVTILLGIAGAFIGTLIGQALNLYDNNEGAGLIVSVIGAVVLLAGYRAVIGRGTERRLPL
jgi:uncharacterized membrane protein YeaQ/YmgE (transglycosylase-associated protein family)